MMAVVRRYPLISSSNHTHLFNRSVERVFSAAGRMHTDLRKSMKDSTLEHSLFAAFNTE